MKLPEAVNYQFMIYPGVFNSVAQLDKALQTFFNEHGLEAYSSGTVRGQGDRPILWLMPKQDAKVPQAPKTKSVKLGNSK